MGTWRQQIGPFANQNALSFTVFKATVPATDANGDRLQVRLCTSGTGNCTAPTIPGLLIDSATGQIQWTTPNWTSGAITLPGCTGTGNSRTCALRAQVSDNAFPSLACPTSNCASLNFTITLRRYDGSGPTANNDPYAVNTMGTLAVAAPGVLGNDTSPVAAFTTLTAQLVRSTAPRRPAS